MARPSSAARTKNLGPRDRTLRLRRQRRARPSLEFLEQRITLTADVWTGASSSLWSDAGNWTLGAPTAGMDLDFPANATNKTSVFDSGLGVSNFGTITIDGSGYDISTSFASSLTLTGGISATYNSSISNFDIGFDPGNGAASVATGGTLELGGAIGGSSGLAVSGGGTLQLGGSSSNTFTGTTSVAGSTTLILDKTGATAVPGALSISANGTARLAQSDQIADASGVTLGSGANLNLNNFDDTIGTLNLTASTVSTGTGTLTLGGDVTTNAASTTATISGKLDLGGATRTFVVADGSAGTDLTVSAAISGTGAGLIKGGAASFMQISGNNTYDGVTTVSTGGLGAANVNALGATSAGTTVSSGATLALQGGNTFAAEPVTIRGNGVGNLGALWSSSGSNTWTGAITLAANAFIGAESSAPVAISGGIGDGGNNFSITKVRSGSVTLSAANTYLGGTTVSTGTLAISDGSALGTGSASVSSGATLGLSGGITVANAVTIRGTGVSSSGALRSTSGTNVVSGAVTLAATGTRIGVDAGRLRITGDVGESASGFSLVKGGVGVLELAANNDFTGNLVIAGGTAEVDGLINGAADLSGGTLAGTSQVNGIITSTAGTVAPGPVGGAGTLTTIGSATLNSSDHFAVDLNGATAGTQYDQLAITGGTATLGNATLDVSLGFSPAIGDSFVIVNNTSGNAISGTFNGLAQGASFIAGNSTFQVNYTGGDGDDVVLTVTSVTNTWDGGGGDNNWTTAANWVGDVTPAAGADLVFPSGAARKTNSNDFAAGTAFNTITFGESGYNILGNRVNLANGIKGTLTSGNSNFSPNIVLTGAGAFDIAAGGRVTLGSTISGSFGFTKTGAGELVLANFSDDTYTGTTTLIGGTTYLNAQGGAVSVPNNLVVGDPGGTVTTVQLSLGGQISDTASATVYEGSTLDVNGQQEQVANVTLQGATILTGPNGQLIVTGGITANQTNNNHATSTIQGAGTLDLNGGTVAFNVDNDTGVDPDLCVSATIANGSLTKTGTGMLALSGANTYDGATTISSGIVQVESGSALGSTVGATTVAGGASVLFSGAGLNVPEDFADVAGAGVGGYNLFQVVSGDATLTGNVTMTGSIQVGAADGTTLSLNGVIDDGASTFNVEIINGPTGRTVLGGSNLFDGAVYADVGFIRATNDNALGDPSSASSVVVGSGGTLELSGGIVVPSTKSLVLASVPVSNASKVMSLAGDNTIAGTISLLNNNQSFDVAPGCVLTVSGAIGGTVDFDKNNAGTLVLGGTSSHTGNVNVGDGKLIVDGSLATSNLVFVDGTLGGSGTLPAVTVSSIGSLAPGNSPGVLHTGNLAFSDAGSTYRVELDGPTAGTGYDQVDVTGTVALAGATLSLSLGYSPAPGTVLTIIDNDSTDLVSGTFNGIAEGGVITLGLQPFVVSYVGGTNGNDVTLTALARTVTWTGLGGDGNWSTAANWDVNQAPTGGEKLVFPSGAARLSNVNDLTGKSFYSIVFAGAGYAVAGNAVTVTNGISSSYAAGASTFGLDVTLTGTETFDVAGGGTLDMSGRITVSNFGGGYGVTKTGGGTLKYSGATANDYNGTTTVDAGTLLLAKPDGVISANGSVIVGDNTTAATLQVAGDDQFWVGADVTVNQGSTFDVGAHLEHISNLNLQGSTVQIDAGGLLDTFVGINAYATTNNATSVVQGLGALGIDNAINVFTIADDPDLAVELRISAILKGSSQASGFHKQGAGTLALSGANTFGGNAAVDAGSLQVESDAALGTTNGGTTVADGASVIFTGATLHIADDFAVAGVGQGSTGVLFDLSGSTTLTGNVSMTGDSRLGAADASTLTINGIVSENGGSRSLSIVQGVNSGRTVLGGASTYSGGTTIASGTVAITDPAAFGVGTVTVGDGSPDAGTLEIDLSGASVVANAFVFNTGKTTGLKVNSGTTTINGTLTLAQDLGVDVATGASVDLAGAIGDGGQTKGLTKQDTGTLILSAANTYTGTTFVDQGLLQLNASGVSIPGNLTVSGPGTAATVRELQGNQIADGATVNMANAGATLDLNGFDETIGSLSLTGSTVTTGAGTLTIHAAGGIITLASSQTATLSGHLAFDAANNYFNVAQGTTQSGVDFSVSAVVSSVENIIKSGAGTMAFSGANTYSGGTNITAGVLAISNNAGAGTGVINVLASGSLDVSGGITVSNTFNINAAASAIRNSGGTNTLNGPINMAGDVSIDTAGSTLLVIAGTIDDSGGFNILTKSGAGTLQLDSANTYTGGTVVSAGVLAVNNSASLGTGGVENDAEIDINNNLLLNNNFTINSPVTAFVVNGLTTIQGTVSLQSNLVISTPGFSNLYLNGVVSGAGFGIDKNGAGTLGLGQANTYDGGTSINGGFLQVFNGQSTGITGALDLGAGVVLIQTTPSYALPSGGLVLGAGSTYLVPLPNTVAVSGPITLAGDATFDVADGGSLTVLGNLGSGSSSLTKIGNGVLILDGSSGNTGTTTVTAGSLVVNGAMSSSTMTTVQAGTTLGGHGSLGPVAVNPSGTFAPGNSPDTLNVASLALSQGATYAEDLFGNTPGNGSTGYDQTVVTTGPVALNNATLSLSLGGGYVPAFGDVLTIVNNQSAGAVNGTFNGLPEGSVVTVGASSFHLSYVGGDGNDVTLTFVVPTATTVTSAPNPSVFGQSVTFTATVAAVGQGATPTGSITFFDGTTVLGTAGLNPSGVAMLSTASLTSGIHGITAVFTASGNFSDSASPIALQGVNPAATSLTLTAAPGSTVFGQSVTFTAVVGVDSPGAGTPTGWVWFLDGQNVLGGVALSQVAGRPTAVFTTSTLSPGTHAIKAQYVGDTSFAGSPTASASSIVSKSGVSTSLTGGGTTLLGQPATFTAFVSALSPGAGTPTGTVTFFDGSTPIGTARLNGGKATFTTSALGVGSHAIHAAYTSGDVNFNPGAASSSVTQVVSSVSPYAVYCHASSLTSTYGQPVLLSATVLPASQRAANPTGVVTFMDGNVVLGRATLVGGVARLAVNNISPGARAITAIYSGGGSALPSSGSFTHVVSPAPTATAVSVQLSRNWWGQTATVFVRVNALYPGAITPSGTAVLYMSGRPFRSVQIVNGVATVAIPFAYRNMPFLAVFQTNPYFAGSRSART